MNTTYRVSIKYTKQLDTGTFKRVSEVFLIPAVTHGDAEAQAYEYAEQNIKGTFHISGVVPVHFRDIIRNTFKSEENESEFYVVKVALKIENENNDRTRTIKYNILVSAINITEALELSDDLLQESGGEYAIEGISKSNIVAVLENKEKPSADEKESKPWCAEFVDNVKLNTKERSFEWEEETDQHPDPNYKPTGEDPGIDPYCGQSPIPEKIDV